jgi:hypothetical protein
MPMLKGVPLHKTLCCLGYSLQVTTAFAIFLSLLLTVYLSVVPKVFFFLCYSRIFNPVGRPIDLCTFLSFLFLCFPPLFWLPEKKVFCEKEETHPSHFFFFF